MRLPSARAVVAATLIWLVACQGSEAAGVIAARLRALGDDSYQAWINGRALGVGGGYTDVQTLDVPLDWLVPGDNVLAMTVLDSRGGALWVEHVLEIEYSDGTFVDVASDGVNTRQLDTGPAPGVLPAGWEQPGFDDSAWDDPFVTDWETFAWYGPSNLLDRHGDIVPCLSTPESVIDDSPRRSTMAYRTVFDLPAASVLKVPEPATPFVGDTITYTIGYSNFSTVTLTSVVACDELPLEVSYVSATPIPDSLLGRTFCWELGDVEAGGERTVELEVRLESGEPGDIVHDVVDFDADNDEPRVSPDGAIVIARPGAELVLTAGPTVVGVGDTITYTLRYENTSGQLRPFEDDHGDDEGEGVPTGWRAVEGEGNWREAGGIVDRFDGSAGPNILVNREAALADGTLEVQMRCDLAWPDEGLVLRHGPDGYYSLHFHRETGNITLRFNVAEIGQATHPIPDDFFWVRVELAGPDFTISIDSTPDESGGYVQVATFNDASKTAPGLHGYWQEEYNNVSTYGHFRFSPPGRDLTGVVVTEDLPECTSFGAVIGLPQTLGPDPLVWELGDLPIDASGELSYWVSVDCAPADGVIHDIALLNSDGGPAFSNDAPVTVLAPPLPKLHRGVVIDFSAGWRAASLPLTSLTDDETPPFPVEVVQPGSFVDRVPAEGRLILYRALNEGDLPAGEALRVAKLPDGTQVRY